MLPITQVRAELAPSGVADDGPARVYRTFRVASGRHDIVVELRDSARSSGYDHRREAVINLAPEQNFVIDFDPGAGGIVFR